jgi:transcriptional regulator with XRE-family HTH domain
MTTSIRDLRESKGLSQRAACDMIGISFARYERIESGSPRTTAEEIDMVTKALTKAKATGKKLVGRPFTDAKKQAAVEAARAKGESVAALLYGDPTPKAAAPAAKKAAPAAKKAAPAAKKAAPAKTAPARKRASRAKAKTETSDLI